MQKIITFLRNNALNIDSLLFLVVAIINIGSESFWPFLAASVLFAGLQDILDELRKSNNNGI